MKITDRKRKILFILLAVVFFAAAVFAIVFLPGLIKSGAERALTEAAKNAYAQYVPDEEPVWNVFLYEENGKVAVLEDGVVTGVYENRDAAAKAVLDDPATQKDESAGYTAAPVSKEAKLCSILPGMPSAPGAEEEGSTFTAEDACVLASAAGFEKAPATFEAWIKLKEGHPHRGGIILGNYGGDVYPSFLFEIYDSGIPRLSFDYGKNEASSATFSEVDVRTGEWLHLAIVNDPGDNTATCYVNGELMQILPALKPVEASVPAKIGGDFREGNRQVFRGEIYSLAVYREARSSVNIRKDMRSFGRDQLIAAWDLSHVLDCRVLPDLSGNGYHAFWPPIWVKDSIVTPSDYDYAFAVIGDTQIVNIYEPINYQKIYDWLCENREEKKIAYVMGLGDITDRDSEPEWERARKAHQTLVDAGIPYCVAIGNHDSAAKFNREFNNETYRASFEGSYGEGVTNTYRKIEIGGNKYLILTMDFGAKDDVLDWADRIIANNRRYNVILITHAFLYPDGTTVDRNDRYAPTNTDPTLNNGDDIWEKLVTRHKNISLVICGHEDSATPICTQTEGKSGRVVTQILSNQQGLDEFLHAAKQNTTGMVTMLYFSEGGSRLTMECYSPVYGKYYRPEDQGSLILNKVD